MWIETELSFSITQLAFVLVAFGICSSVSIVNFEHVIAGWEIINWRLFIIICMTIVHPN